MEANAKFSILNALCELDISILSLILDHVDVGTLISLSEVSKLLSSVCNDERMWKFFLKRDWSWPQAKRGKGAKKKQEKLSEMTVRDLKQIYAAKLQAKNYVKTEIAKLFRWHLNEGPGRRRKEWTYARRCSHARADFIYHPKLTLQITHFYCPNCTMKIALKESWAIEPFRDRLMAIPASTVTSYRFKVDHDAFIKRYTEGVHVEEPFDEEEDENDGYHVYINPYDPRYH